jgi:site-specific DNA-methyltransferase (adenine-specific)
MTKDGGRMNKNEDSVRSGTADRPASGAATRTGMDEVGRAGADAGRRGLSGKILLGDALGWLQELEADSVDTVVTSPPYFLLRNYGVDGQLGAETTVEDWVAGLRSVMAEVARVIKDEGSVWLNLGDTYSRHAKHGALPKSLLLGPERLLLGLIEDGWVVRNKLVWAKPNPMPASVRDRLSCTWEPMYLLVRSRSYFFDLDAVRMAPTEGTTRKKPSGGRRGRPAKYDSGSSARPHWSGPLAGDNAGLSAMKRAGRSSHPLGKNPGDVWTLPTAAYHGAHFATFPEGLVERPLLAGCPERTCRSCGTAWRRPPLQQRLGSLAVRAVVRKSCACAKRDWQPGLVLDPFMGAGTVGVVAERLGRRWLGIELSQEFVGLAEQRIATARAERDGATSTTRPTVVDAVVIDDEEKQARNGRKATREEVDNED